MRGMRPQRLEDEPPGKQQHQHGTTYGFLTAPLLLGTLEQGIAHGKWGNCPWHLGAGLHLEYPQCYLLGWAR